MIRAGCAGFDGGTTSRQIRARAEIGLASHIWVIRAGTSSGTEIQEKSIDEIGSL